MNKVFYKWVVAYYDCVHFYSGKCPQKSKYFSYCLANRAIGTNVFMTINVPVALFI